MTNMQYKLNYNDKNYIYGFEQRRDFPTRGKTSLIFYIKLDVGYKIFKNYRLIFRTTDIDSVYEVYQLQFTGGKTNKMEKHIIKKIDDYILTSRRRKLKMLNQKGN